MLKNKNISFYFEILFNSMFIFEKCCFYWNNSKSVERSS